MRPSPRWRLVGLWLRVRLRRSDGWAQTARSDTVSIAVVALRRPRACAHQQIISGMWFSHEANLTHQLGFQVVKEMSLALNCPLGFHTSLNLMETLPQQSPVSDLN